MGFACIRCLPLSQSTAAGGEATGAQRILSKGWAWQEEKTFLEIDNFSTMRLLLCWLPVEMLKRILIQSWQIKSMAD